MRAGPSSPRGAEPIGSTSSPSAGRAATGLGWRSLQVRIVAAFLSALVVVLGAQFWLLAQQTPVRDSLRLVADGYLPLAQQVAQLRTDLERAQRDLQRLGRDRPRPRIEGTTSAEIFTQELSDDLEVARLITRSMRRRRLPVEEAAVLAKAVAYLDAIALLFQRYDEQARGYVEAAEVPPEGSTAEGSTAEAADRDPALRALRNTTRQLEEEFDKLETTLEERIRALAEGAEQRQAQALAVSVATAFVATGVGLLLIVAVLYALRPIGLLTAEVQRLAAGQRGARVAVSGRDEVGLLAAEFNAMVGAIEERDQRLQDRAAELDRLSRYLASVVDTLEDALLVTEDGLVTLANPTAVADWGAAVGAPLPAALDVAVGRHDLAEGGRRFALRVVPFGDGGQLVLVGDVTEERRALDALARSERLALIGQMLAQITHEVRNPLNALSLNAELLTEEVEALDPDQATEAADILRMIAGEVERLVDVTGHYLQLARRPPAQWVPTDVVRLVGEVVRLLRPEVEGEGGALVADLGDVAPQRLDGNQIRQALHNVVRNALEAGGRRLHLRLRGDPEGGVVLSLADDGPGMDAEALARATDPFFSTKASGTGLGLAITRQILEDHDGHVAVTSAVGEGTTVALVLPWRPARPDEDADPLDDPDHDLLPL